MSAYQTEGSILIGRADNPTARFHEIVSRNDIANSGNWMQFNLHDVVSASSVSNVLTLRGDRRVGIGTNAPSASLLVAGNARITSLPTGNVSTDQVVTSDANGNLRQVAVNTLVTDDQNLTYNSGTGVLSVEDGNSVTLVHYHL